MTLPRLKGGIDYVPGDFFPAFLDKGEMVLTAEEAQKVRGIGGVAALDSTSYGGGRSGRFRSTSRYRWMVGR